MAENSGSAQRTATRPAGEPLLRQGRPADPVPATVAETAPDTASDFPDKTGTDTNADHRVALANEASPTTPDEAQEASEQNEAMEQGAEESGDVELALAESRQRQLRLMLRQCDRVLLMDFDLLAMSGWPDNYTLAAARQGRDLWLFSTLIAAVVFLSGMTGVVPAWIAGGGFGAFVIILLLGVPPVRRLYTSRPSYMDLIVKRQRLLRDARKHIAHLEGGDGLIWQCGRMAEFNPALRSPRFSELLALSEHRVLPRHLSRREHIRLYLIYLLEAEKAYSRVQQAFFEGHQRAIDNGWVSVASEPEARA